MLARMGTPPCIGKKRTFQVGTQQLAAIGLVSATRLFENGKGSAQGLDAARHNSGTDRFHAIAPELIEELQELR
jgi:hypothetical protein